MLIDWSIWLADSRRLWSARDSESAELRARHVRALLITTPWTMSVSLLCVALCVAVLLPHVDSTGLWVWAGGLSSLLVAGLLGWWRQRGRSLVAVKPKIVRNATLHAAALGLLWGLLPTIWFAGAGPDLRLLIAVLITGLTCAGALALAMLPPAALAYTAVMMACAIVSLGLAGGAYAGAVQVLMVAYTATLMVTVLSVSRLFTARLVSEREASRQSEVVGLLLRDFEESSADVLWEIDRQGRFVHPSLRLAELFERPVTRLAQLHLMTALRSMQQEGSGGADRLQASFDRGEAFRDQVVRVNTKAGVRWWSITAKPVFADMGQPMGWRGVLADVTNERQSHQHLAYLAHFDSLTGLANRVSVRNRLVQVFEGQSTQPRRAALMCMDLDNFKAINDTHGHSFGDAVLQEMARRLRGQMRKRDLCGRLGGDEFAVVLDDVRSDEEALALAQRLVVAMRVPIETQGVLLSSGVSVGLAFLPEHGRNVDEALMAADLALYAAKAAGRGRVESFTPALGASQRRRNAIERELREALVRDELQVVYQPQVDLKTWRIVGAEALVRWHHPTLGMVSPVEFVPVAEATGLIHNIGAFVLARACSDADRLLPGLRVAVNASAVQIQRPSYVNELHQTLKRYNIVPDRMEIEITESLLMEDVEAAMRNLHVIKELGVRIALDDFGTGYSSLAYLRRFPFDKLKIDRAFIRELMGASDARAIVRTILDLAKVLGMSTVAEGVEEPAQLDVLQGVGCALIQGFLVARPMPPQELADLIARWDTLPRPMSSDDLPASMQAELSEH